MCLWIQGKGPSIRLYPSCTFDLVIKLIVEVFKQIKCTAMGKIFAPTYATLLMGYFEMKLYSVFNFKYGEALAE